MIRKIIIGSKKKRFESKSQDKQSENTGANIKLGASASVDIIVEQVQDQIVIPITAIFSEKGQTFVTRVVAGKQEQVPVETAMSDGYNIAVESGLKTDDQIILNTYKQTADKTGNDQKIDKEKKDYKGKMGYYGK
jgi:hypothetical protein